MPYYINDTNGNSLVAIQDGTIDQTTTSLTLVGKNFPTFGQYLNQNFVSLLENFANTIPPDPALSGQIWYDSNTKSIKFYREGSTSNNWQKLANTSEGSVEPLNPRLGDLWWDTNNSQLKLYDTTTKIWRVIGPQTTTEGQLRVIGSNSFDIQVGGNSVFTIDSNGGDNTPLNPFFMGSNYAGVSNLSTTNVNHFSVWKPNIVIDNGSNFNYSTGTYTVKTSGYYKVDAYVTTLGNGEVVLKWFKNSAETNIISRDYHDTTSIAQLRCSGIIKATAGDSIQLLYSTDAPAFISYENSSYTIELIG